MWVQIGSSKNRYLDKALTYSMQYYIKHTDWFLRHRDAGLQMLGFLITAQSTLTGLYFARKVSPPIQLFISAAIVIVAILLTYYFSHSCRRAYRAALRHAAMTHKVMWAMGLTLPLQVTQSSPSPPLPNDESLFVPDIVSTFYDTSSPPISFATTEDYVNFHLNKLTTTYASAVFILCCLTGVTILIAVGTAIAPLPPTEHTTETICPKSLQ